MVKNDKIKKNMYIISNAFVIIGFLIAFISLYLKLSWQFFIAAPLLMLIGVVIYLSNIDKTKRNFYIKVGSIAIVIFFVLNEINRIFLKLGTLGFTIAITLTIVIVLYIIRLEKIKINKK